MGHYNDNWEWVEDEPQQPSTTPAPPPALPPNGPVPGRNQWGIPDQSPNAPGYDRDLSYWMQHGVTPTGPEGIFDANGQLRPGWRRTGRGYERVEPENTDTGDPDSPTNPTRPFIPINPGTQGGGAFSWPNYNIPDFIKAHYIETPGFDAGPTFTHPGFQAPDPSQIANDPAFQFRFKQGIGALSAQRAGQGTFLSGAAGKALQDYGQNAASQEYGNIWNRSLSEYDTNRNNAFGNWAAQYGQRKDTYGYQQSENAAHNAFNLASTGSENSFNTNNAQFDFNGRNQQATAQFQDLFNRYKTEGDWLTQLAGYDG